MSSTTTPSTPSTTRPLPSTNMEAITAIIFKRENIHQALQEMFGLINFKQQQHQQSLPATSDLLATDAAAEEEEKDDLAELKDIEHYLREHPAKTQEPPKTTLLAFHKDIHEGEEYTAILVTAKKLIDSPYADAKAGEEVLRTCYDTYKAASKMFRSLSEAGLGEEAERWLRRKREIRAMVRGSLMGGG